MATGLNKRVEEAKTKSRFHRIVDNLERSLRWIKLRYTRSFRLLNRVKVPGFRGAGLYDVMNFFFSALGNRHFTLYGAAMAFQFFFALFPGLIFLFSLLPFIPIPGLKEQIEFSLKTVVPGDALNLVNSIIHQVYHGKGVGLLSINLFLTLYGSLNGIRAMMFAFSKRDKAIFRPRGFLWSYLVALLIFVILLLMLLLTLTLSVYGTHFLDVLHERGVIGDRFSLWLVNALNTAIVLMLLFAGISVIFYLAPETHTRWNIITPGSILAGVLFLLAVWAFKTVVIEFVNYNRFYGSLSAVMLLMFWFYWVSLMMLIGFELNAAIDKALHSRKQGSKELVLTVVKGE